MRLLTTLDHLSRGRIMQGTRELIDLLTRQIAELEVQMRAASAPLTARLELLMRMPKVA